MNFNQTAPIEPIDLKKWVSQKNRIYIVIRAYMMGQLRMQIWWARTPDEAYPEICLEC